MTCIHAEVKKWGNSLALIIPAEEARQLDIEAGANVDAEIRKCARVDAFGILKGKKSFKEDKDEHETLW